MQKQQIDCKMKNVIWLNHLPKIEDVYTLSLSEHFDVIILHHFTAISSEDWERLCCICQSMAQHVIVEDACVLDNHDPFVLVKRSCIHPKTIQRTHTLHFDYSKIFLVKVRPPYANQHVEWHPGINLMTYLAFNGYYPDRKTIVSILPLDFHHRDWMPNNMILQGKKICLIDKNDPVNQPGERAGFRLCENEFFPTQKLILQSKDLSLEQLKQLFCDIYDAKGLLGMEAVD
jgi:hypothetical protein